MKSSIATVSLAGRFADKGRVIAAAGFDGIEICEQDFLASGLSPHEEGADRARRGAGDHPLQPFRDFEGLPAPLRSRAFAQAGRKLAPTAELSARQMLLISSVHPATLGDLAARHGVRVGLSALVWGALCAITATRGRWTSDCPTRWKAPLAARGFPARQIGPNHYTDLEARFGLAPDLIARLKLPISSMTKMTVANASTSIPPPGKRDFL